MRFSAHALRTLAFACALVVLPAPRLALASRIPVADFPPGYSIPQSDVVFKAELPLDELGLEEWTVRQRGEIAYFREQMRKRDEIFLLLQVTLDAIGRTEENRALADDVAQAVGLRLLGSGIPADRMLLLPGREDPRSLEVRRLSGFPRYQKVEITGFLGSSWLRRRPLPEVKREVDLPRPAEIVLLEPSVKTTDRSNHTLRGNTDSSIRVVSVTIGEEARSVSVRDGAFEAPISLRAGENPILVIGLDPFGRSVRAAMTVRYIPPRPSIEIVSPKGGAVTDITRSPVIAVRGSIRSKTPLREAFLIQNAIPRRIRIREDGSFEQPAILMTEEDTFQVEALDTAGQVGTSAVRTAPARGIPDRTLMAILHWDEDDVDLDLHVTDLSGNHTYFDAADPQDATGAIPEGRLWIDNRKGYGPEVFSLDRDAPGEYTLSAEYYRGKKPSRAFLTLVLFAGTPSRKLVRVYGPVTLSPREPVAPILKVSLPSGIVRELLGESAERVQR